MADGTIDIEVKVDAAGAHREMDGLEAKAKKTEREMEGVGDDGFSGLEKSAIGAKGALQLLAGAAAAVGLKELMGEAVGASDALTKFDKTMSAADFGGDEIMSAKSAMKEYADQTVYDTQTMMNTTAQLAANGIEDYVGLTQAAGNMNAAFGGSEETMRSVAMVMTQTAGAGNLTTENWNQLTDAIPGASGKLQEALLQAGAYTGNFRKAMEDGEITADEFNAAVMQIGGTPVAVEAAKSVDTFEGAMGNAAAGVTSSIQEIVDKYKPFLTDFITGLGETAKGAVEDFGGAVSWLADNFDRVGPVIMAAVGALGAYKLAMLISGVIQTVTGAVNAFKTAQEASTIAQAALNAVLNANPFMVVVTLLGLLVGAFVTAWTTNEEFRNLVIATWDEIKRTASDVWGRIVTFFTVDIPGAIDRAVQWFQQLPGRVQQALSDMIARLARWVQDTARNAADAGSRFMRGVSDGFNSAVEFVRGIPGRILGALGNLGGLLVESGKSMLRGLADGIRQGVSGAIDAVKKGLSDIRSFFPFSPAKRGPFSGRGWVKYSGISMAETLGDSFYGAIGRARAKVEAGLGTIHAAIDLPRLTAGSVPGGARDVHQTIVFQSPVRTPDEMAREARMFDRYGLGADY